MVYEKSGILMKELSCICIKALVNVFAKVSACSKQKQMHLLIAENGYPESSLALTNATM